MARTFKKRGLRRDLNFADIPTPETALNNMLGDIAAQGETGDRFISQDLDVIRGIRRTTMTRGDFLNIDGAAPTIINETNGIEEVYKPIITLQNRFDQARFTIGEPQFFGGNGLTARYFEQADVNIATSTTAPSSLSGVTSNGDAITFQDADGNEVTSEIFWEQGQYTFVGNLNDGLSDVYGGVVWNGWFKPTRSGRWRWSIGTTGLFTFEFNTGVNAVSGPGSVVHARLRPVEAITLFLENGSSTATISSSQGQKNGIEAIRHLLVGDILWNASVAPFNDVESYVTISDDLDFVNESFTMSTAFTGATGTYTVYATHPFGENASWSESTGNLSEYEYYPITIRYIWKDTTYSLISNVSALNIDNSGEYYLTADSSLINNLSVNVTPPNSSSSYTNYKYLYDENYERNPTGLDKGDFYTYYENRVPPGGTRITNSDYQDGAIGSSTNATEYENVFTKGQLVLPYEPPKNYNDIVYTKTMNYQGGSIILTTGNTDGIEVGNLVIPTTGALKTSAAVYVTEISINEAVFLSEAVAGSSSGSETYYFVDHRGLKRIDSGTTYTSGNSVVGSMTTAGLEIGDVVINAGVTGTGNWNVIDDIINASSFDTSINFSASANSSPSINAYTFVYERAGLKNDSLDTYCNGVYGATTISNPNDEDGIWRRGATQITVTNPTIYDGEPGTATLPSSGYFIFFGDRIPAGTTASVSGSTINLSNPIDDDIPADQVVVLVATNENKDLCFPPTDTSPPFTATQNGLQTTSSRPSIEITGTDSEVKFIRLFVENGTVNAASANPAYDTKIPIKDLTGTTYNILADEV